MAHKTVFEEWYLFHGSAALDAVNERVQAGPYKDSHGKFLRQDLGGECAGLYYARKGDVRTAMSGMKTQCTLWFNKVYPTYEDLFRQVAPATAGSALWRRLLVLGPTPEFHVDVDPSTTLPEKLTPYRVMRTRVRPR